MGTDIESGWWHRYIPDWVLLSGNPNGRYVQCGPEERRETLFWNEWPCQYRLQFVEMKLKPFDASVDVY